MRSDYDPTSVRRMLTRGAATGLVHGLTWGLGYLPSLHRPKRARDIRTLVFMHGLGGNRANFFPLQTYLRLRGHGRQYSFNYRSTGSIEALALFMKKRIDENVHGGRIDLICHSMGGVIGRFYLQQLGGHRRVDRFITLATPHHGSHSSAYIPSALVSQLKPDGPFLQHLNSLPPPEGVRCHSFAAEEDLMVLPPASALAPFGETRMFDGLGHSGILLAPRVLKAVQQRLSAPQRRR